MKKTFKLQDLDCANCAAKMEKAVCEMDGVNAARINFMTQSFMLDADDGIFEDVLQMAEKRMRKIERDVRVVRR